MGEKVCSGHVVLLVGRGRSNVGEVCLGADLLYGRSRGWLVGEQERAGHAMLLANQGRNGLASVKRAAPRHNRGGHHPQKSSAHSKCWGSHHA